MLVHLGPSTLGAALCMLAMHGDFEYLKEILFVAQGQNAYALKYAFNLFSFQIIVWKRYSDFKKLHKELWQIHRNLFRHSELFPPFAKGIVFGKCSSPLWPLPRPPPSLHPSDWEFVFSSVTAAPSTHALHPHPHPSDWELDLEPHTCSTSFLPLMYSSAKTVINAMVS